MLAPHLLQMKKKVGCRHVWCGHLQHENKKKMFCMHQHVGTTPSTDEKKKLDADMFGVDPSTEK